MHMLHDRNPLFVQLSNGDIRNGYDLKILNKTHSDHIYALQVHGLEGAVIEMVGAGDLDELVLGVAADSVGQFKVFVHAPVEPQEPIEIEFVLQETQTGISDRYKSMFISERPH